MSEKGDQDFSTFIPEVKSGHPELVFFFSAHGRPKDYAGIESELANADVFVIESHGWNDKEVRYLQEVSDGKRKPKHVEEGREPKDAAEYEEKLIYNTGKRIEIIDVPEGHELDEKDDGTQEYLGIFNRFISNGDLDEALGSLRGAAKLNAAFLNEKDKFLESRLHDLIARLQADQKQVRKVLVQMGSSHINFSHNFRSSKTGRLSKNTIRFDFLDELVRHFRLDKEPDDMLVLNALAQQLVLAGHALELATVAYIDRNSFFRKLLSGLSQPILKEIGKQCEQDYFERVILGKEADDAKVSKSILDNAWLKVTGIDLSVEIANLINEQARGIA